MGKRARALVSFGAAAALALGCGLGRGPSSPAPAASSPEASGAAAPRLSLAVRTKAAPIRLTASDGTGLRLTRLESRGVIVGPVAYTELHLWFQNGEARVREGTLGVTLPRGASPSRLAVKVGDALREAEMVERAKARATYDDFLHRREDPMLLETNAGGELSARIFPILPLESKEIVVGFAHEVTADAPYVLPLRGLPQLDRLDVEVAYAGGGKAPGLSLAARAPDADYAAPADATTAAARSGTMAAIRVRPDVAPRPDPLGDAVVLVDTSASRATDLDAELAQLDAVIAAMPPAARLVVGCFDQAVFVAHDGPARDWGQAGAQRVRDRGALGASDLARGLTWASGLAGARGIGRVVVLSDGVATAGATGADAILRAVDAGSRGARRVDVVGFGAARDDSVLRAVSRSGAHPGALLDAAAGAARVVAGLGVHPTSAPVSVAGATWVWPARLEGLVPGEERVVYAELPAEAPLVVGTGGPTRATSAQSADRLLVARAWARARIDALAAEPASADVERKMVALSIESRVLSPYTALLMLDRDQDYSRYGIERRANTGVLSASDGRAGQARRDWAEPGGDALAARGNMWGGGEAFGQGGLGLSGPSSGGGTIGRGAGAAASGAHRTADAPSVRSAGAQVSGRIPPEIIQRVVRRRTPDLRACYTDALARRPDVRGRVSVRFVIATNGDVGAVTDGGSTVNDPELVACVVRAFRSLAFPAPEAGVITVVYPLIFGSATPDDPPPSPPEADKSARAEPYAGRMKEVQRHLAAGHAAAALDEARGWYTSAPGDVMALDALGEALEASRLPEAAARAYGSIVDLHPGRADLRRFAAERLQRLGAAGIDLATDDLDKALVDRPDHPSAYHLAGMAHLQAGRPERAFELFAKGMQETRVRWASYPGVQRVLAEDAGLAAAAWRKAEPERERTIADRLAAAGGAVESEPSLRFVLVWESDASDVDFHVRDAKGNHAFFGKPTLPSGGSLYADVRRGYGPECFTIRGPKAERSASYQLAAHYYDRGPMGYGMGTVQVIEHDGAGAVKIEHRPFVVMNDGALLDLGAVR